MLHRFHARCTGGYEAEYLVAGADTTTAALRLASILGTNDKIHEAFPAPVEDASAGIYRVADLPCPMDRPDDVGLWLQWTPGRLLPAVLRVEADGHGHLAILDPKTRRTHGPEVFEEMHATAVYTKVVNPLERASFPKTAAV
jgi:hypothetical protein